ncbi:MAG: ASCH domain-containing protein [Clostridium sp.]|nr:ASCH domain-containing protein [Clostridium sp.]
MNRIDLFWNRFLEKSGYDKNTKYLEVFHFELTEDLANKLLKLVLEGKKKATSSSFEAYEKEGSNLPKIGDLSIVTDWDGNPRCIIETKNITIIPFKDITYDICSREGEDDSLESWREGHIRFFSNEGKEIGYEFTEDMLVVFEDFEVIYQE